MLLGGGGPLVAWQISPGWGFRQSDSKNPCEKMIRQTVRPAESEDEDEGDDSLSPGVRSLNQLNNYLVARRLGWTQVADKLGIREQKIPKQKQ